MKRVIIMGAAGRDYHNFLTFFKSDKNYKVVAFTQSQIPGIEERNFPKSLAGRAYSGAIPFYPEEKLPHLIKKYNVDEVFLSYSDLSHEEVMQKASLVLSMGASFTLLGPKETMLHSKKPVIAVCGVRTGVGKSSLSLKIMEILKKKNYDAVAIRHPMPYGNLKKNLVQRFASVKDFKKYNSTIEEQEEYHNYVKRGFVIYAGVDYKAILEAVEKKADVILWDGGNNDFPFYHPDLLFVVTDPFRAGQEIESYPGEANFLMANILVINKVNTAPETKIKEIEKNIKKYKPHTKVLKVQSLVALETNEELRGKNALVIGDGPTLTHGGMSFGAGTIAAKKYGIKIIDAKKYAEGSLKQTFKKFSHIDKELPALGYSKKQIEELRSTINKSKCDVVLNASPSPLKDLLKVNKPVINVTYSIDDKSARVVEQILTKFLKSKK